MSGVGLIVLSAAAASVATLLLVLLGLVIAIGIKSAWAELRDGS